MGLTLIALALRLPQLSASFYGDETFSLFRDSEQLVTPTEDRFRFLFFSLLYLWKQLGFHGEVGLRSLPLLFGVLQVPVAYQLGRSLGGARGALTLAGLVTVSPLLIEFSQELRMYSLVPLVALLQAWALQVLHERSLQRRGASWIWAGFVLAGVVGVYTHFHYWFLNAGFGLALLRRRDAIPLKHSALALAALAALYLPNLPNLMRFQSEASNAPHLTTTDLPGALPKLLAAFVLGFNYFALPSMGIDRTIGASTLTANASLAVLALVPLALVGYRVVRLHWKGQLGPALWMAHELFTAPVLISFVAALIMGRNFVHPKYMVFCAPFLLLFFVAGFLALPRRWERWGAGIGAFLVFSVAFAHFNQPRSFGRREDLRGVAELIRPAIKDDTLVLWLGSRTAPGPMQRNAQPQSIWEYYGADLFPQVRLVGLPKSDATPEDVAAVVAPLVEGRNDVYFVWLEIARNTDDPGDLVLSALTNRLGKGERVQLNPRLIVYHWGR